MTIFNYNFLINRLTYNPQQPTFENNHEIVFIMNWSHSCLAFFFLLLIFDLSGSKGPCQWYVSFANWCTNIFSLQPIGWDEKVGFCWNACITWCIIITSKYWLYRSKRCSWKGIYSYSHDFHVGTISHIFFFNLMWTLLNICLFISHCILIWLGELSYSFESLCTATRFYFGLSKMTFQTDKCIQRCSLMLRS